MKTPVRFLLLALLLSAIAGSHYIDVPSFRLYIGYVVNPSTKIIPNDDILPRLQTFP